MTRAAPPVQAAHRQERMAELIDSVLPQTQCGQCGQLGCRPYAAAVAGGRAGPDRCLPGGPKTARAIAKIVGQPLDQLPELAPAPSPQVAVIDEDRCVGCVKCIVACPVDAIVGTHGFVHTVISDWCTGCGLCVAPCPVDCVDLRPLASGERLAASRVQGGIIDRPQAQVEAARLRARHQAKTARAPLLEVADLGSQPPAELARIACSRARKRMLGRKIGKKSGVPQG